MYLFLAAGLLYLLGVGILLAIKPTLMFSPDGGWKEFSIGKDTEHGTPFPFWMFCLLWGIVSYLIVFVIFTALDGGIQSSIRKNTFMMPSRESTVTEEPEGFVLPPGYYMLNKKGSKNTPRYVYIGEEPPT